MKNQGFSLVEVLISLSILSFILMAVYGVLGTGNKIFNQDMILVDLQQQARNGLDRMVRDIRASSTQTITVTDANHDSITFTTPTLASARYYVTGTNLIREYPIGTTRQVASNIARLKFTLNSTLLIIDIRADKTTGSQTRSLAFRDQVRLRNQ